jgi:glyceraldehyde-3-phosphate dehydrogenase (NAD(P))
MGTKKNILVVGTGTIGEPLIGVLSDFRKKFNANIFFHKRTPLVDEVGKVDSLIKRGARLVTDPSTNREFVDMGHPVSLHLEQALQISDVVIDCTPAGNENKEKYYSQLLEEKYCSSKNKKRLFIAQGSEKHFGLPYAYGINDSALKVSNANFIQVVSCNTHNICSLIKTMVDKPRDLLKADFVCIRRSNDISQKSSFVPSPEVGKHPDVNFGTHHARDAQDVFGTLGEHLNLFSSAMKLNTQYMHIIRFNMEIKGTISKENIVDRFKENKFTALTHKTSANRVFSFGRDHGYYGRIFNHTVLSIPSLHIQPYKGNSIVSGFCFTPQDGNSLLSSCAAAMWGLYGGKYHKAMKPFEEYLFTNI